MVLFQTTLLFNQKDPAALDPPADEVNAMDILACDFSYYRPGFALLRYDEGTGSVTI